MQKGCRSMKSDMLCIIALAAAFPAACHAAASVNVRAASYNIRVVTDRDTGDRAWKNRCAGLVKYVRDVVKCPVL